MLCYGILIFSVQGPADWDIVCPNITTPTDVIHICDLRAKVLVACLVTPALWLNLSDSRNILIIHFGLLLKERTLDSIGHDLWKKYIT